MNSKPTPKEIGQRIAALRKRKGLSQEELARRVNISRPSLAQIELGNRTVSGLELLDLAEVLGFSIDGLLAKDFSSELEGETKMEEKAMAEIGRVSVPTLSRRKLQTVLLYLLERCAGKPNVGETVLNKLLYFADFNYFEQYEEHLTGATYRKLPFGPVSTSLDRILEQMVEEGKILRIKSTYHGYPQTRFLPLEKPDLRHLKASETEVLDKVMDQMSDWSAQAISSYSHQDIPWQVTEDGKEINYELALYRELPFRTRVYQADEE